MIATKANRRDALRTMSAAVSSLAMHNALAFNSKSSPGHRDTMTLGFSTYGMKTLKTESAVEAIAMIGFDAIEITVWPDWDAAPVNMDARRRQSIRKQLSDSGLILTSLMEHIIPSSNDADHEKHKHRLNDVFELAGDLALSSPPLVQTVLGGGQWEQKRHMLRDRVGDWLELATRHETVLAIKPHRGGVMSRPQEAVWLIEQLGKSKFLRIVYDYSHYTFRDMTIEDTVDTALPYLAHVAVKDAVKEGERIVFKLPGESGTIPFDRLLKRLHTAGYTGDISCEVSGMVWNKPGYDPVVAATQCYRSMSAAFEEAAIPRSR